MLNQHDYSYLVVNIFKFYRVGTYVSLILKRPINWYDQTFYVNCKTYHYNLNFKNLPWNNFTDDFSVSGDKEFFNVGVCLVLGPNGDAEVTADVDVTIQLDRRIEFVSYHSETGKTMVTQVKGIGNKVEKCVNVSMVTFR